MSQEHEFELRIPFPNDIDDEDMFIEDFDDDEEDAFHTIEQHEAQEREWHPENFSRYFPQT